MLGRIAIPKEKPWTLNLVAVILALLAAGAVVGALARFPLPDSFGIDWRGLWLGLQDGRLDYTTGIRNPPWSVIVLLPLGLLPMQVGWAAMAVLTILVLALSVPRGLRMRSMLLSGVLLATSFPALRQIADGNTEPLAIAGILLVLYGFERDSLVALAAGVLLASGKPQESWLLLGVVGYYLLRSWPLKKVLCLAVVIAAIALPSLMLFGAGWPEAMFGIQQRGSLMDASLLASAGRFGLPPLVVAGVWLLLAGLTLRFALSGEVELSRAKTGLLVSGALLLAPYSAGNSTLAVLAIGTVALIRRRLWLGLTLFALADLGYLAPQSQLMYEYGALYATGLLTVNWIAFAWVVKQEAKPAIEPDESAPAAAHETKM